MADRRRWDIHARTQMMSLGPALLLTLMLISFFTFVRLQDLRQELNHTGQLIANQLAPATEFGVISGNTHVLETLMQASLNTPHVQFVQVQDRANQVLVHAQQPLADKGRTRDVEVFEAPVRVQSISGRPDNDPMTPATEDYLGRVLVGMSSDAFNERQQDILLKAMILALFALGFTYLLARRLASNLSQPISDMSDAVKAIQQGHFNTPLPVVDDGELGSLARHINNLAHGLAQASREQQTASLS